MKKSKQTNQQQRSIYPTVLRTRKERLDSAFADLSKGYEHVAPNVFTSISGIACVQFNHRVRVNHTNCYLDIFEEFQQTDTTPLLFAFAYRFISSQDMEKTLFRYEYHPAAIKIVDINGIGPWLNKYGTIPHFHPDDTLREPIIHLHYPVLTVDQEEVVFELVKWLQEDLVTRFVLSEDFKGII